MTPRAIAATTLPKVCAVPTGQFWCTTCGWRHEMHLGQGRRPWAPGPVILRLDEAHRP